MTPPLHRAAAHHLLAREAAAGLEVEAGKAEYGCTVPGEARQRGQDMGIIGDCGVQLSLTNPHTHTATTPSPWLTELDTYLIIL